jgi:heavy metal sensor kinase
VIRPPHWSLRMRLTFWYAGVLFCVLLTYAGTVYIFLERSLWQQLDQRLHESTEDMESLLPASWSSPQQLTDLRTDDFDDEDDSWIEVWSLDGRRLFQSPRAGRLPLEMLGPPQGARVRSVQAANGRHLRVSDEQSHIGDKPVIIRAAASEDSLRGALLGLFSIMALGLPIAVGTTAYGGYRLARRALRPVDRMAESARLITAERLGDRLDIDNPSDEIGRLGSVMNEMFGRLETAFDQMRRFTADASHELRTPLTAIRTVGEVALREGRDLADYREVIGSMLEETDEMTRLVEALLMLSRADAGQIAIAHEVVDLSDLVRRVAGQLEVLAEEKQQTLAVVASEQVRARVDPVVLRLALVNLVDNAIRHSPIGARVTVRTWASPSEAVIDVEDNGPAIPAIHLPRVFDRFYRVERARTRQGGGVGLGLAISQWAVRVQAGEIEVLSEEGTGSVFRIRLPQALGTL